MTMVKVATRGEVPVNGMCTFDVGGMAVLVANLEGGYYAIADRCTHLGGSLGKGELSGRVVTCPRHGAQFDVTTGEALGEAKLAFLKMKVKAAPAFRVEVAGDDILVELP